MTLEPWIAIVDWIAVAALVFIAATRLVPTSGGAVPALLHDFTPLLGASASVALISGFVRSTGTLVVAACVALVGFVIPHRRGPRPSPRNSADPFKLVAANVYIHNRTPELLAADLVAQRADVIVVAEWNSRFEHAINDESNDYQYRLFDSADHSDYAVSILSRVPFQDGSGIVELGATSIAHAIIKRNGQYINVIGANPTAILDRHGFRRWAQEMRSLRHYIEAVSGPLILAGDLNTTRYRPEFRRLLGVGLTDALEPSGTSRTASFRLGAHGWLGRLRPLIRLDHILVSLDITPRHSFNLAYSGSDHAPVVATVTVDSDPVRDPCPTASRSGNSRP